MMLAVLLRLLFSSSPHLDLSLAAFSFCYKASHRARHQIGNEWIQGRLLLGVCCRRLIFFSIFSFLPSLSLVPELNASYKTHWWPFDWIVCIYFLVAMGGSADRVALRTGQGKKRAKGNRASDWPLRSSRLSEMVASDYFFFFATLCYIISYYCSSSFYESPHSSQLFTVTSQKTERGGGGGLCVSESWKLRKAW